MYRNYIHIWRHFPARPQGVGNINHAFFSISRKVDNLNIPILPNQRAGFTFALERNPRPRPTGTTNNFNLTGNSYFTNINSGTALGIVRATLGNPIRMFMDVEDNNATQTIGIINQGLNNNANLQDISTTHSHSVPCCYYLALRANGKNHETARVGLSLLKCKTIKRSTPIPNGVFDVPIDQTYSGQSLFLELRNLGYVIG